MVSICSSKSLRLLTKEVPNGPKQKRPDGRAGTHMAVREHKWPWRNIVFS